MAGFGWVLLGSARLGVVWLGIVRHGFSFLNVCLHWRQKLRGSVWLSGVGHGAVGSGKVSQRKG